MAAVGDDSLLNPNYCGPYLRYPRWNDSITDSSPIFNNTMKLRSSNKGLTIENDHDKVCQMMIEEHTDYIPSDLIWRFDIPIFTMYPTVIIAAIIWLALKLIEYALSRIQPGCYADFANSLEHKRKVVIYLSSTLFYSVILVMLLWVWWWDTTEALSGDECKFIYNEFNKEHSVSIPYALATAGSLSIIYLVIELMYRVKVST